MCLFYGHFQRWKSLDCRPSLLCSSKTLDVSGAVELLMSFSQTCDNMIPYCSTGVACSNKLPQYFLERDRHKTLCEPILGDTHIRYTIIFSVCTVLALETWRIWGLPQLSQYPATEWDIWSLHFWLNFWWPLWGWRYTKSMFSFWFFSLCPLRLYILVWEQEDGLKVEDNQNHLTVS